MLTKTQRLYDRREHPDTGLAKEVVSQLFIHSALDDEGEANLRDSELLIANDLWDDLGAPETITVTIEPGDGLNG